MVVLQVNSVTNHLELSQTAQVQGTKIPLWSDASYTFRSPGHWLWQTSYRFGGTMLRLGSIICYNNSQDTNYSFVKDKKAKWRDPYGRIWESPEHSASWPSLYEIRDCHLSTLMFTNKEPPQNHCPGFYWYVNKDKIKHNWLTQWPCDYLPPGR